MTVKAAWSAATPKDDYASLACNEHSESNTETDNASVRCPSPSESEAAVNRSRMITTWLDHQPAATVRRALGPFAYRCQQTDPTFDLWLALVDLHLGELHGARHRLIWNWKRGYQAGWSPRTAAFAAWANNVDTVGSAGAEG